MSEFLQLSEALEAHDFNLSRLPSKQSHIPDERLVRFAEYLGRVNEGKASLREAMSTSDFPQLFGQIIDRQLYGNYIEASHDWSKVARRAVVNDFKTVERYVLNGGEGLLTKVPEGTVSEYRTVSDEKYSYSVNVYDEKIHLTWQAVVNDDLQAFMDMPQRLARAARRTEEHFVTSLYVGTSGPDATFYAAGNSNIVTSNPALSIEALQTAMQVLAAQTDSEGMPIIVDAVTMVVPPALEITARNILNATEINVTPNASLGTEMQELRAVNWMRNRVTLVVNPWIPYIATSGNGNTSWFLFANPTQNRPALEMGFLRGYEAPTVYRRKPDAEALSGSPAPFGNFDTKTFEWGVMHILGGSTIDPKLSVASNGSGS